MNDELVLWADVVCADMLRGLPGCDAAVDAAGIMSEEYPDHDDDSDGEDDQ